MGVEQYITERTIPTESIPKNPRILLVMPPAPFLAFPNASPHLGLGYLISYLRENHVEADYIDYEMQDPKKIIIPEGYDLYGFTSVTPQYYYARLLKDQVTERKLGRTIIGGAHASISPMDCLKDGFDFVVRGYGEKALLSISRGERAPGIIPGEAVEDINSLPFPAWDQLLKNEYSFSWGDKVAHIFTVRGCPFDCYYCCSPTIYGRRVQKRDIENVMTEISLLKEKYNINSIYFFDPTFTLDRIRTMDLASRLREFDLQWTFQTRVDHVDAKLLEYLKASGCDQVSFGIEAGSEDVQSQLGKRTTVDQNALAIAMAHDAGLKVKAFLMGALPDENQKTTDKFKEFILRNRPDSWLYSTFIPFPGTDYWENPEKYGIEIVCRDSRAYYPLGLNARGPLNVRNRFLSRDELRELRNDILSFLRNEIPNPRVEKAIQIFPEQLKIIEPYLQGLDRDYLF